MINKNLILKTVISMIAFAGNSVLCRLALKGGFIDPVTFSDVRLASGAIVLLPFIAADQWKKTGNKKVLSGLLLATYVVCFSAAYVKIDTGAGALLLFGSVQAAMISWGIYTGERLNTWQWAGLITASGGLVMLLLPGSDAPALSGALLMVLAGLAWAAYSIAGRGTVRPATDTARNFVTGLFAALMISPLLSTGYHMTMTGLTLAILSGVLASACAYVLWYSVLPALTPVNASTIQLSVPCLATLGGTLFVGEQLTGRSVLSTAVVLTGIFVVIRFRTKRE